MRLSPRLGARCLNGCSRVPEREPGLPGARLHPHPRPLSGSFSEAPDPHSGSKHHLFQNQRWRPGRHCPWSSCIFPAGCLHPETTSRPVWAPCPMAISQSDTSGMSLSRLQGAEAASSLASLGHACHRPLSPSFPGPPPPTPDAVFKATCPWHRPHSAVCCSVGRQDLLAPRRSVSLRTGPTTFSLSVGAGDTATSAGRWLATWTFLYVTV